MLLLISSCILATTAILVMVFVLGVIRKVKFSFAAQGDLANQDPGLAPFAIPQPITPSKAERMHPDDPNLVILAMFYPRDYFTPQVACPRGIF